MKTDALGYAVSDTLAVNPDTDPQIPRTPSANPLNLTPNDYDSGAAEYSLGELKKHEDEILAIQTHAQLERGKIDEWEKSQTEIAENKMRWHKNNLVAYTVRSGQKTLKLINGTVKRVAPRMSIDIVDEAAIASEWMKRTEKTAPDKKRILDHLKKTGEIVQGVELNEGEVSYSFTTK